MVCIQVFLGLALTSPSPSLHPDPPASSSPNTSSGPSAGPADSTVPASGATPTPSPFAVPELEHNASPATAGPAQDPLKQRPSRPVLMGETEPTTTVHKRRDRPDRPIRYRFDLGVDGGSTVVFDPAYLAFDDNRSLGGAGVVFRGDVPLGSGRVFLGGALSYHGFSSDGAIYHDGSRSVFTGLKLHDVLGHARMSVRTVDGVDLYVDAGIGPTIAKMTFDGTGGASQQKVSYALQALAGTALYLPKKWLPRRGSSRVTGGLDFGIGYMLRGKVDVAPTLTTEDDPIDTTGSSFGNVFFRGLSWRLGVFVRFM